MAKRGRLLLSYPPMWLRIGVGALMAGLILWVILDHMQTRALRQLFADDLSRQFIQQAEANRLRFDQALRGHSILAQTVTDLAVFKEYLRKHDDRHQAPRLYHQPPPWLPRRSLMRAFAASDIILIVTPDHKVWEGYARQGDIPPALLAPSPRLLALSSHQAVITTIEGAPYVIAAAVYRNAAGAPEAHVIVASQIDAAFLAASQGVFQQGDSVTALVSGDKVVVSSEPRLSPGTPLMAAASSYERFGRGFLDYGAAEVPIGFVTFIPRNKLEELLAAVVEEERTQRTLLAGVLIGLLLIFLTIVSARLRRLSVRVEGLAQRVLPGAATGPHYGDEVRDLERRFRDLARAVLRSRRALEREAQRLRAAKTEAEMASRTKSEFLANMSHELRTPLNAIIGFAEIMGTRTWGPLGHDRYEEYVKDIENSGRHLLGLINDLLDMAKIEAGQLQLVEESCDLGELVERSVRLVRPRAEQNGATFTVRLPQYPIRLYGDPVRLMQVLLNLLGNAAKFSEADSEITLCAAIDEDGSLAVMVRDTGIGMGPDEINRAMQAFGQAESHLARRYEGTGLGLPLARNLIELHGGTLDVDSRPGAGLTAWIVLPASRVLPPPMDDPLGEASPAEAAPA